MLSEECALVWMSAGNSYFTEEAVSRILNFASQHFPKIMVMAPDEPAEHAFRALGYENMKTWLKEPVTTGQKKN